MYKQFCLSHRVINIVYRYIKHTHTNNTIDHKTETEPCNRDIMRERKTTTRGFLMEELIQMFVFSTRIKFNAGYSNQFYQTN